MSLCRVVNGFLTVLKGFAMTAEAVRTSLSSVRRDALPEFANYPDTGCHYHDSCLTCPFDPCIYEMPAASRTFISQERKEEIRTMRFVQGMKIDTIAAKLGVGRSTVFRALRAP